MLKHHRSLLAPDPRHQSAAARDRATGLIRQMQITDLHDLVQPIELGSGVPLEIRQQFDLARNAFVYSWFTYDLATLAEQQAYAVLEMALRRRAETQTNLPKRRGLAALLKVATERGWLRHEEFEVSWPSPTGKMSFLDLLPLLRNELAHGSTQLFPQGSLEALRICAVIINKLFPETSPSSAEAT